MPVAQVSVWAGMEKQAKQFYVILTVLLLAPVPFCVTVVGTDVQQGVTEVSGTISKDTTWSGNILVTWGVFVAENSILTVEPGTTIEFKHWRHGYADPDSRIGLGIRGTMKAMGTPDKPIRFTSDAPDPEHGDWWGIGFDTTSTHSIIDHCIIEYAQTGIVANRANFTLSNSIVRWSTGANVYLSYSSANITHNRLYENSHGSIEIGYSNPTITYNTIWGSTTGGIYSSDNSHPIIRHNIIRNCFSGIGIFNFAAATIEYNAITETELGIEVIGQSQAAEVTIKYNNIYGNKNVNIQTDSTLTDDVNATNNWWGTTNETEIESKIMDSRRNPALRTVFYEPYLTSEVDIGTVVYDFENNETYTHLPGTENDTFLYIYPDDDTRKIVDSWHPFDFPTGIAWDGQYLWIVNQSGKTISEFDTSLRFIDSFPCPATSPYGLAFDGGYLWLMEYLKPLVYQLDVSGKVIKSIPAPREHCMGLAWDGNYLWTMSGEEAGEADFRLYKFDTSGNITGIVRTGVARAGGIAWDGRHLWVVNTGDDMIYEIEPSDGRIIRSITTPGDRTFGMAWQGPYLWCTDWTNEQTGSGRVFKILPMEERMTIDGLKGDWLDFSPLIFDPEGDNVLERADIKALYGFTDHKYLYLMVEFYHLGQYHHVDIEIDFDNDGNRDYLLRPSADQTSVSFTDVREIEAKTWTRSNVLFIPYSSEKDVNEIRIPLAFIENRSQFHVRVLMQGEQQTIDETGWVYVGRKGEQTFDVVLEGIHYAVSVVSNSTVSNFNFNKTKVQISFNVTGESGTTGYCNVTIPKSLLRDSPWTIKIDNTTVTDFDEKTNDTHTFLHFTYTHGSSLQVTIEGTWVVPEFPSNTILPIFIIPTVLVIAFAKKRLPKKLETNSKPIFLNVSVRLFRY